MPHDKVIDFPNAKINLGLFVCKKRPEDGYHILQTLFYPIDWRDALEILPAEDTAMIQTGITIDGDPEQNLCMKAYRRLQRLYREKTGKELPSVAIHLEKRVPFGAGLGGGSSDGAFTLALLRNLFELPISEAELEQEAAAMGADCAFFLRNTPQYCEGVGHEMEPYPLSLKGKFIVIVKPPFGVSTKEAYSNVHPAWPATPLCDQLAKLPVSEWKAAVRNDFEDSVFPLHPELVQVKQAFYDHGAVYASMSGSGSACFGIFDSEPQNPQDWFPEGYEVNCHEAMV